MNKILTNRRDNEDKGFTLIELMVVVLIIAILLAIAIPTFLGAQTKAKDRGAQSAARNALTAAKTIYADKGAYTDATPANLLLVEPSMVFVAGASTDATTVSVLTTDKKWYAAVLSKSGECFFIQDSLDPAASPNIPGTSYYKVTPVAPATCTASASVAYSKTGW